MKGVFKRLLVGTVLWAVVVGAVGLVLLAIVYGISVLMAWIDWQAIKNVVTWLVWIQLWWSIGAWFRAKRRKA